MTTSKIGPYTPWEHDQSVTELFVFCLPFGGGSKNRMHIVRRDGRKILSESARKFKQDVGILAMAAARDVTFKPGKVWLSIFVELPEKSRSDAINLVDMIADGVQEGIGINDRNFAIWKLDWARDVVEPNIYVAVGQ